MSDDEKNKKYTKIVAIVAVVLIAIVVGTVMMLDKPERSKRPKAFERKMKVNPGGGGFSLKAPDFLRYISLP